MMGVVTFLLETRAMAPLKFKAAEEQSGSLTCWAVVSGCLVGSSGFFLCSRASGVLGAGSAVSQGLLCVTV